GLLLAEARTRQGLGLSEVAERLDPSLDATELMALESGALEVEPSVLEQLAQTYGVAPDALVPPRSALVIDLNEGYLRAGPDIALLTDGDGRDAVLTRYLEMVWELRSVDQGSVVALRGADISALSKQLGEEPEVIEAQLRRMMTSHTKGRRTAVLVGLAAAVLAITGGVIAWQASGSDTPEAEPVTVEQPIATTTPEVAVLPPAPEAEIGEPEVLERDASEVPATTSADPPSASDSSANAPSNGALPPAPSAEIGDAAVLERQAVPAPEPAPAPAPAPAPRTDLESLSPAPSASVGDAAVVERNPDGSEGQQQTR
ncbi:MAG: helix-turn-helix domain-containing protein, partial [Microthrixaceae bacterium]